ncbi:hypothetical protein [Falsiroseomonas oryzae]|uniref:hypothetical protein n=1 Tax=Falsiroseomonas oryzae TaxID=2766473 RepID=UPI0022EAF8F2|nr:hypothetical protein [Roseomonas sp. MO-31]
MIEHEAGIALRAQDVAELEARLGSCEGTVADLDAECQKLALAAELGDASSAARHDEALRHLNAARSRMEIVGRALTEARLRHEAALADRQAALHAARERAVSIELDAIEADGRCALAALSAAADQLATWRARVETFGRSVADCPGVSHLPVRAQQLMRSAVAWRLQHELLLRERPQAKPECPARRWRRDAEADLHRAGILGRPDHGAPDADETTHHEPQPQEAA